MDAGKVGKLLAVLAIPIAVSLAVNGVLGGRVVWRLGKPLFEQVSYRAAVSRGLFSSVGLVGWNILSETMSKVVSIWEKMPKFLQDVLCLTTWIIIPFALSILTGSTVAQAVALTVPSVLAQVGAVAILG